MKRLKGLYKDSLPIDQPEGSYSHAENINLNMDIGSMTTEQGIQELSVAMTDNMIPLAYEVSPDKRLIVWYVDDVESGIGEFKDGIFTPILTDVELGFTRNSKIATTSRLDKEGDLLVYWTDGVNSPRFYNVDEQPTYSDINELNIFDFISSIGTITLDEVRNSGGSLWSGSYVFAMRYIDEDDNKSNFFDITRPINIIKEDGSGFIEGTPTVRTSKSIRLALDNLDNTYDYAEIAVIRYEETTIADVTLLPKVVIDGDDGIISYGGNTLGRDISLEEVTINKVSYTSAKAMTQLDGVMYMANMTRSEEVDYQAFACNIDTHLVKKNISELDHGDEDFTYYSKSFRRGEVYAFYISFILKDGTETEAFHIPGRDNSITGEMDLVDTTGLGNTRGSIADTMYQFQLYARADTSYGMALWKNPDLPQYRYPNNSKFLAKNILADGTIVNAEDLRNKPVRHHRFPDELDEPVISSVTGRDAQVSVLGVQFKNIKIPQYIKERVKAVKFYYAEKNNSNRINLDEGFAVGQNIATNSQWNDIQEPNVYRNSNLEDPKGGNEFLAVSILPFSSMLNRQGISGVDYVLRNRICRTSYVKRNQQRKFTFFANKQKVPTNAETERNSIEYINDVDAISYYDGNKVSIALQNFTFPYNKSSLWENSGVIFNITQPPTGSKKLTINYLANLDYLGIGASSFTYEQDFGCIYTLCSFKTIVHHPFSQETLVSMGEIDTNLDKFDPTHPTYVDGSSKEFYTGDTFINRIGHLVSFDENINGDLDPHQAMIFTTVQSYDNIAWRQSGESRYDRNPNNPALADTIMDDNLGDDGLFPTDWSDNYYAYDPAHSVSAYLKTTVPDQSVDKLVKRLPTRVIRSAEQNPETNEDSFRTFLENDYLDLPSNRGDVNKLATNNSILIVHTENSLFRTRGREELATGDFRAFLGSGDIFEVQPTEIFNTRHGFAGLQDVNSAIETKDGYFFVDSFNRRVYLLSDKIEDLTEKGMRNFFHENLEWFIDKAKSHTEIPYVDIVTEYDERYNRLLLTKIDYEPTQLLLNGLGTTISFNEATGKFNNGIDIEYNDTDYFTDKSFTLTYMPEIGAWVSFHSYKPLFYMNDGFDLYSYYNDKFWKHNSDQVDYMNYYGSQNTMHFQFVDNREPLNTKHLTNVEFLTHAWDRTQGSHVWNKTFDDIRVRNSKQDSGLLPLVYFTSPGGNIRNVEGTWRVNKLRDLIDPATGTLDINLEWHKKKNFIGKYALIDLYYDTPNNTKLSLVSANANFKQSVR